MLSPCSSTGPAVLQALLYSSLVFSFILRELQIKSRRSHFRNHLGNPKALGRLSKLRSCPGGRAQLTKRSSWFHISAHPEALSPSPPPLAPANPLVQATVTCYLCSCLCLSPCFCSGCRQQLTWGWPSFHLGQTPPPGSPGGSSKPPVKAVPLSLS